MEFEHSMPISQMGMLRPGEAPSKAGVGPGLEPGALGCSCCLSPFHLLCPYLSFSSFSSSILPFNLLCLYSAPLSTLSLLLVALSIGELMDSPSTLNPTLAPCSDHVIVSTYVDFILSIHMPHPPHFSLTFVCLVLLHPCSPLMGSRPHAHLSPSLCLSPPYRVLLILISSITFMPSPSESTHCCLYLLTLLIPSTPPLSVHMGTPPLHPCHRPSLFSIRTVCTHTNRPPPPTIPSPRHSIIGHRPQL